MRRNERSISWKVGSSTLWSTRSCSSFALDQEEIKLAAKVRAQALMNGLASHPNDLDFLCYLADFLEAVRELPFPIDLWEAQNIYYVLERAVLPEVKARADAGQEEAVKWMKEFQSVGTSLHFVRAD